MSWTYLFCSKKEGRESLDDMMDRADVAVSEKFSQVLRAYQIENDYGRTLEAYSDTISIAGVDRKVDVLKVGRISLMYQTGDGEETGRYNHETGAWEEIDDSYQASIRQGIRMARQQATTNLFSIPVTGAEAAR